MSGAAENRWSRGGPQQRGNRNQGPGQQNSGTNTPTRQDSNRQQGNNDNSAQTSNAWTAQDRGNNNRTPAAAAAGGGERRNMPAPTGPQASDRNRGGAAGGDAYVPINGFNAAETRTFLTKSYRETVNAAGAGIHKKVEGDSTPKRTSGGNAWAKQPDPKVMASGANFWTTLSTQLRDLEQKK